jgi:hypothetical protein
MLDPFDLAESVALDDRAPWFEWLTEAWPDRETSRVYQQAVHRLDVQRAAQPPVVNVTVPGVPGHFTGPMTGPVAYVPDPDSLG